MGTLLFAWGPRTAIFLREMGVYGCPWLGRLAPHSSRMAAREADSSNEYYTRERFSIRALALQLATVYTRLDWREARRVLSAA